MKIERLLCPLLLLILVGCGSQPQRPATSSSLDRWIEQQLIPHLQQRLTREPRLMGQPILIGGLRAGQISPLGDQLSHSIARRLTQGLLPQRSAASTCSRSMRQTSGVSTHGSGPAPRPRRSTTCLASRWSDSLARN